MKKYIPWLFAALLSLWGLSTLRGPKTKHTDLPLYELGALPIVHQGRPQPLDSLARNSLLILRKKQTLNCEPWKGELGGPKIVTAMEWLTEVMMDPTTAATRPCFRIDNEDVKGLLRLPKSADKATMQDGKHYSWNQISAQLPELERESERITKINAKQRNVYEKGLMDLAQGAALYRSLTYILGPGGGADYTASAAEYQQKLQEGAVAWNARMNNESHNTEALEWLMMRFQAPLIVPPAEGEKTWKNALIAVRDAGDKPVPTLEAYSKITAAYLAKDKAALSAGVQALRSALAASSAAAADLKKGPREMIFHHAELFYKGSVLTVVAFLCGIFTWFSPQRLDWLRRTGVWTLGVALVFCCVALATRMLLEGRPPVTNLYSSAVFIAWGAILLSLILELIWPRTFGLLIGASVGFLGLLVGHFLSLEGDTMVMMQAVLDTNIWLATHVVIVTFGYVATFVAGFVGIFALLPRLLVRGGNSKLDGQDIRVTEKMLGSMIFGITCFAVLLSFVGTVLGGIWADQSWGRFWGWDPKENGALMIVLWNALILHARLGGMVKLRGLINLVLCGNIVTAWSWFGTNQLGIGLHSYGFNDNVALALYIFFGVNLLAIIVNSLIPKLDPVAESPGPAPILPPDADKAAPANL